MAGVEQDRVEDRAVDVVLALLEGAVAGAHGLRAAVAGELGVDLLGQVAAAVDAVHDLEAAVLVGLEVGDELDELLRLPVQAEEVQRAQREARVAHPRVAVVPVALAARRLRQRGRQRRHRGAGGHVRQALDRERRALDRLTPRVIGEVGVRQPPAPELRRRLQPPDRVVVVVGHREALAPAQRAEARLALLEHVPGADAAALDPRDEIGPQAQGEAGAGRVDGVALLVGELPVGRRAPVVEHGLADRARSPRGRRCSGRCARGGARRPRRWAAGCAG